MTVHKVSGFIRSTDIGTVETFISERASVIIVEGWDNIWFKGDESLIPVINDCPVDDISGQIHHVNYTENNIHSRLGDIIPGVGITWGYYFPCSLINMIGCDITHTRSGVIK